MNGLPLLHFIGQPRPSSPNHLKLSIKVTPMTFFFERPNMKCKIASSSSSTHLNVNSNDLTKGSPNIKYLKIGLYSSLTPCYI